MSEAEDTQLAPAVDKRELFGWKMYDWGWSAHTTTVVTALLGPYLFELATDRGGVKLFGWTIEPGSYYPFAVALAAILQVIVLPLVGAAADYSPNKKRLLLQLALGGSLATTALFFVTGNTLLLGGLLFVAGAVGFAAAGVVYNSYLPEIAPPSLRDSVSASGYAYGYVGGGLYLALNFALIAFMEDTALAVRISLGGAGLWAALFIGAFTGRLLRSRPASRPKPTDASWLAASLRGVVRAGKELWAKYPITFRFLIAYTIFNDGIQTVIAVATSFAADELGAEAETLLLLVLMIQFMAVPGAIGFGRAAQKVGTKRALMVNLAVWSGLVVYAYGWLDSIPQLWGLGVILALVLGGSQALARSLFSQMIPSDSEGEYFGFYEIASRGTTWIGPLVFGVVNQVTGSQRQAIISLIAFFVIGLAILATVNARQAMIDAGQDPEGVRL